MYPKMAIPAQAHIRFYLGSIFFMFDGSMSVIEEHTRSWRLHAYFAKASLPHSYRRRKQGKMIVA
jgi:hypothetical protein